MKGKFNFVNIAGNAFTEIPNDKLHVIEFDNSRGHRAITGAMSTDREIQIAHLHLLEMMPHHG